MDIYGIHYMDNYYVFNLIFYDFYIFGAILHLLKLTINECRCFRNIYLQKIHK